MWGPNSFTEEIFSLKLARMGSIPATQSGGHRLLTLANFPDHLQDPLIRARSSGSVYRRSTVSAWAVKWPFRPWKQAP